MVILDTSILIDHLRNPKKPTTLDNISEITSQRMLAISVITIQELFEGKSTKEVSEDSKVEKLINSFEIFPYTSEVAKAAGIIARDSKTKIDLADAAIAATAILNKATLATLNKKDFLGIKDIEFL